MQPLWTVQSLGCQHKELHYYSPGPACEFHWPSSQIYICYTIHHSVMVILDDVILLVYCTYIDIFKPYATDRGEKGERTTEGQAAG